MYRGRFQVEDYAILARPKKLFHLAGEEVQIVKVEEPLKIHGREIQFYVIEVKDGERYPVREEQLDRLPSSYLPSTWDKCLWRPK